jgi:hypothetical protein
MIAEEETANRLDEFRNVLRVALLKSGVLGNLRAQLRLSTLEILKGSVGNNNNNEQQQEPLQALLNAHSLPSEGTPDHLALMLVFDFLNYFPTLKKSSGIFAEESGLCLAGGDRFGIEETKDLASQMKMNQSEFNSQTYSKEPLLVTAVRKMMTTTVVAAAAATTTTSSSNVHLPTPTTSLDPLSLTLGRKTLAPVGALPPLDHPLPAKTLTPLSNSKSTSKNSDDEPPKQQEQQQQPKPVLEQENNKNNKPSEPKSTNEETEELEEEPFVATNFLRSITADAIKNSQIQQQMIPSKQFFTKEFKDTTLSAAAVVASSSSAANENENWDSVETFVPEMKNISVAEAKQFSFVGAENEQVPENENDQKIEEDKQEESSLKAPLPAFQNQKKNPFVSTQQLENSAKSGSGAAVPTVSYEDDFDEDEYDDEF